MNGMVVAILSMGRVNSLVKSLESTRVTRDGQQDQTKDEPSHGFRVKKSEKLVRGKIQTLIKQIKEF